MNREPLVFGDTNVWTASQAKPAQQEFGYIPPASGLPAWRYEFPHRMSSSSPEFTQPAAVPVPGSDSMPLPSSLPASGQAAPAEKSK